MLENAAFEQGQYDEAERLTRSAFACSERAGDRWFIAYVHNDLGRSALLRGDRGEAEQRFKESLAIRTDFGDIGGTALAEQHLAGIEAARGDLRAAEQRLRRCLRLFSQARDRGAMAQVLTVLGRLAITRGRPSAAAEFLAQALGLAREADLTPLAMEILVEAGQPGVLADGTGDEAVRLLGLAAESGQTSEDIRAAAEDAIERSGCGPAVIAEARRWARRADADTVIGAVAEALRQRSRHVQSSEPGQAPASPPVERLSERESEVLDLLAEGWSNERIGRHLGLRVGTVKWHTSQLYSKLGVRSRTDAVAAARRLGLLG